MHNIRMNVIKDQFLVRTSSRSIQLFSHGKTLDEKFSRKRDCIESITVNMMRIDSDVVDSIVRSTKQSCSSSTGNDSGDPRQLVLAANNENGLFQPVKQRIQFLHPMTGSEAKQNKKRKPKESVMKHLIKRLPKSDGLKKPTKIKFGPLAGASKTVLVKKHTLLVKHNE